MNKYNLYGYYNMISFLKLIDRSNNKNCYYNIIIMIMFSTINGCDYLIHTFR